MDKLRMQTANKADENFKKLAAMFPNAVTETINENGEVVRAIDKDVLMQEISCKVVDGNEERYQFTWPDKKKSVLLANAPINKTLRPCREESVDFDTTENLYIEGDNLEVLKLLQETYLGKIKMIYIDPPYNTGNDFVYEDDFAQSTDEYLANSGQFDEEGNRMVQNTESNGRFHTDWLNMMYPRLKLAKDLLSEDGVIFISLDDGEIDNLKKISDEVLGSQNYVGTVIWERAFAPKNDAKYFSTSHDFVLVYAKNIEDFEIGKLPRTQEANARYKNPDNDPRGPWAADNMTVKTYSAAYDYPITTPNGTVVNPTNGRCWFTSKERMQICNSLFCGFLTKKCKLKFLSDNGFDFTSIGHAGCFFHASCRSSLHEALQISIILNFVCVRCTLGYRRHTIVFKIVEGNIIAYQRFCKFSCLLLVLRILKGHKHMTPHGRLRLVSGFQNRTFHCRANIYNVFRCNTIADGLSFCENCIIIKRHFTLCEHLTSFTAAGIHCDTSCL